MFCLNPLLLYLTLNETMLIFHNLTLNTRWADLADTVFDVITAHTPISAQSNNSVGFRLEPVYFLSISL